MAERYTLPSLPYDFNALEPVISEEIMKLHYLKHHQTYVTNLNNATEQYALAESKQELAQMIELQSAIKFNGGGHLNHSIFWTNLAPENKGGGQLEKGELQNALIQKFGSLEQFIERMNSKTVAIQGSGWGWLGYHKTNRTLCISACANQDPLSTKDKDLIPLLGIDVWEHAYYLQYKNVRAEYLKNIWRIVNWKNVEQRFLDARK